MFITRSVPEQQVRDLFTAVSWLMGLFGKTVTWRDRILNFDREGRIQPATKA